MPVPRITEDFLKKYPYHLPRNHPGFFHTEIGTALQFLSPNRAMATNPLDFELWKCFSKHKPLSLSLICF